MSTATLLPIISQDIFWYKKQGLPAEKREVFVTEETDTHIRGVCMERRAWRSFKKSRMNSHSSMPVSNLLAGDVMD